jgi:hypothetical protein
MKRKSKMVSVEMQGDGKRTFSHFYEGKIRIYVDDVCVYSDTQVTNVRMDKATRRAQGGKV